jgi:uncharacterized protein (UPF0128 family)
MNTDEDDEFDRIAHENEMKSGQPYHYDVYVSPSQRNQVLEEVAKEIQKMTAFGQVTLDSFSVYIRGMKS